MSKRLNIMTSKEVKEYLGISKSTLNRWVNEEGVIPKMKIRNKIYFKREDIEKLLNDSYSQNKKGEYFYSPF